MAGNDTEGMRYGSIQTPEKYYLAWKEDLLVQDGVVDYFAAISGNFEATVSDIVIVSYSIVADTFDVSFLVGQCCGGSTFTFKHRHPLERARAGAGTGPAIRHFVINPSHANQIITGAILVARAASVRSERTGNSDVAFSIPLQNIQTMRNFTLPIVFTLATLMSGCGGESNDLEPASTLAVIGDVPYGTGPDDNVSFLANPAFITAINSDPDASLVLHVGDIHSGKQYCTNAYDVAIYQQWMAFKNPLVYTPGDNEWTDCHKAKQGGGTYNSATGQIDYKLDASGNKISYAGGDPLANLTLIRSIYFANPGKALGGAMNVHSQAQEYDAAFPTDSSYVENVWWEKSRALFVTLNIPGGSNNDTDPWYGAPAMSPAQAQEVTNRTAANLRWLDAAFKQASSRGAMAVVIQVQADMWDLDGAAPNHIAQYKQFTDSIASHATAFGKPVLLLNGDSHVYRSDNPLVAGAPCVIEPSSGASAVACNSSNMPAGSNNPGDPYLAQPHGYNVPNFHRLVVHGSIAPQEWLKLTIDPNANAGNGANAFGPFSWKRIQPGL